MPVLDEVIFYFLLFIFNFFLFIPCTMIYFNSILKQQETWRLEIAANPENGIMEEHSFTLKELKEKFQKHEVVATLQCAGEKEKERKTKKKER